MLGLHDAYYYIIYIMHYMTFNKYASPTAISPIATLTISFLPITYCCLQIFATYNYIQIQIIYCH